MRWWWPPDWWRFARAVKRHIDAIYVEIERGDENDERMFKAHNELVGHVERQHHLLHSLTRDVNFMKARQWDPDTTAPGKVEPWTLRKKTDNGPESS